MSTLRNYGLFKCLACNNIRDHANISDKVNHKFLYLFDNELRLRSTTKRNTVSSDYHFHKTRE